jgi:hypothetical protein
VGILTVTLAASMLLGTPRIVGTISCPTADQIQAAMSGLPSNSDDSLYARITEERGTVLVEFTDAKGSQLGARAFATDPNCERLARSVAVVLAAWSTEVPEAPMLPPRRGNRVPVVSNQPEMLDPASLEAEQLRAEQLQAKQLQAEPTGAPPLEAEQPQEEKVSYDGPWSFELGLAPMGSISSSGAAGAADIYGFLFDRSSGLGGLLSVFVEGKQSEQLQGGTVSYQRVGFALGPAHRWSFGALDIDVDADAVLGLLMASGSDYPTSSAGNAVQPGLRAGARLGMSFGALQAWVGGWGLYWIGEETLELAPNGGSYLVPSWEVLIGAGVGYRVF